jgi:hypothetical protein
MRRVFFSLAGLCLVLNGWAQEVLRKIDWNELSKNGSALVGTVGEKGFLEIESTNSNGLRAALLKIENPSITLAFYAIRGEIRYEGVEGDGFLEMWSIFPPLKERGPESQFFSRTLGMSGEMGKISGTSTLRSFLLPFDRTGAASAPSRLELNLVLPGKGTVYIGPLELVQYATSRAAVGAMTMPGAWWSDRTAGWIGGIGGTLVGCFAALISFLAARQKARGFVVGTARALIGIGFVLGGATLLALVTGQPYGVWYPLALGAVLLLAIVPVRLRGFRRQYEDHELRKMAAADAVGQ